MRFHLTLIPLTISLLFTACTPTPDVPLSPELSQYELIKENCEELSTTLGLHVPDDLDKECASFLRRLDKVSALEYKVAHYNDDDPDAKPKPEFYLLETKLHRQYLKAKLDYEELVKTLNKVSRTAIKNDELDDVQLTLKFPETEFTKKHYLYYKEYAPQFDQDPHYLSYKRKYAERLVRKGLAFLGQGDKHSALKRFKKAASLDSAQAEYLIGIVYEEKHVDKAIKWHTQAEEHGIASSRINLARLYKRTHDEQASQKWYLKAAEENDAYAQFVLYQHYSRSTSDKNAGVAQKWLQRSAENGYPQAEYAYAGQLFKNSDLKAAEKWYIKAKDHGISSANDALGNLYFEQKRYSEALPLLEEARSADARYRLGVMYEQGLAGEPDYYRAYKLYKEAARLGRIGAKKDIARVDKLKTEKERAYYEAERRKQRQYKQELASRCGENPIKRIIRKKDTMVYLSGIVSLPLESTDGFIVNTDKGKQFFVMDIEHLADVRPFQYVHITAKSTGNAISISSEEGLTVEVYQFNFDKRCHP